MPDLELRQFNIREANWTHDQPILSNIRRIVFIVEQQVPQDEEWDGKDEDSWHWLATDVDDAPIGTARLLPSGQIGRMAVLEEKRGLKVGAALLEAAVEKARYLGFESVFLNAQSHALSFYEKAGFAAEGEEFMEAGIAHYRMQQPLSALDNLQQRKVKTGDLEDVEIRHFDTAEVEWNLGGNLIRNLRKSVLKAELGLDETYIEDSVDESAIQFHSKIDHQTVGAVRLELNGTISRLIVDSNFRRQGVGTALLEAVLSKARRFGLKSVNLGAASRLTSFFQHSGFTAGSDSVGGSGEDESTFSKSLSDAVFKPTRSNLSGKEYPREDSGYVLGETAGFLLLRREEEFQRVVQAMCEQARQHIQIMSPLLDHKIFDTGALYETCSELARKNKYTRIEILLYDSHRVVKNGHSLLEIARRLPSSIQMKLVHPELRSSNHEYVLVDEGGLIYRQDAEQYEGYANFRDVTEANRLRRQFRSAWQSGLQDPNLRQLKI